MREEAVGDGAGGGGEEAVQDFPLAGRGEPEGGQEAVADGGVVPVVVESVGVESRGRDPARASRQDGRTMVRVRASSSDSAIREARPSEPMWRTGRRMPGTAGPQR